MLFFAVYTLWNSDLFWRAFCFPLAIVGGVIALLWWVLRRGGLLSASVNYGLLVLALILFIPIQSFTSTRVTWSPMGVMMVLLDPTSSPVAVDPALLSAVIFLGVAWLLYKSKALEQFGIRL